MDIWAPVWEAKLSIWPKIVCSKQGQREHPLPRRPCHSWPCGSHWLATGWDTAVPPTALVGVRHSHGPHVHSAHGVTHSLPSHNAVELFPAFSHSSHTCPCLPHQVCNIRFSLHWFTIFYLKTFIFKKKPKTQNHFYTSPSNKKLVPLWFIEDNHEIQMQKTKTMLLNFS